MLFVVVLGYSKRKKDKGQVVPANSMGVVMGRRKIKMSYAGVTNSSTYFADSQNHNQVALWVLKILLDFKGWRQLQQRNQHLTSDIDILAAIDLEHLEDEELTSKTFIEILKKQRKKFEGKPVVLNKELARNSKAIAEYLGLNSIERQLLVFAVILEHDNGLKAMTDNLGELKAEGIMKALSALLVLPLEEIRKAFSRNGLLSRSGILTLNRETPNEMQHKLEILDGLAEALQEPGVSVETMLARYITPAGQSALAESNYRHVADYFTMIREHLHQACEKQARGVNILIYGPPGTGKTELAKTVSQTLGKRLYEVNIGNEENAYDKPERLRVFQLAQQVLSRQKNALILFDEIDNVLAENISFFLRDNHSLNLKAWINNHLENNPVPAIWIANDIRFVESAFIRRFDIVLFLDTPPRSVRLEILGDVLQDLPVRQQWIERLADNKQLTPAVVTTAARVVRNPKYANAETVEKKIEQLLESTLTAMGYPRRPVIKAQAPLNYRLDAVNPDHDLEKIVQGLQSLEKGCLCLYGPPGTGKTEFCRYLAQQIDKPLLVKQGSDLLASYLGETEANISAMFHEAVYEDAVLLLDEADSFLRDRNRARHSWEVSQVNELLTRMELYSGIFVCSTNLMDCLDGAVLRRFDLKIKFDFLKVDQAWNLFHSIFQERGLELHHRKFWKQKLAKRTLLTPGDFATVIRKNRISGKDICPESLIEGLDREMDFKTEQLNHRIGFLSTSI